MSRISQALLEMFAQGGNGERAPVMRSCQVNTKKKPPALRMASHAR